MNCFHKLLLISCFLTCHASHHCSRPCTLMGALDAPPCHLLFVLVNFFLSPFYSSVSQHQAWCSGGCAQHHNESFVCSNIFKTIFIHPLSAFLTIFMILSFLLPFVVHFSQLSKPCLWQTPWYSNWHYFLKQVCSRCTGKIACSTCTHFFMFLSPPGKIPLHA